MSTNPVSGNQNFTSVDSAAGQLATLSVGSGTINTLIADTINSDTITTSGKGTFVTKFAYAPRSFSTLGSGVSVSLMNNPGLSQATSTADDVFVLPSPVVVTKVIITNNGITVSSAGDLATITTGPSPTLNAAVTASDEFSIATTVSLMNNGAIIGGGDTSTGLAFPQTFGTTGILPTEAGNIACREVQASDIYVNVTGATETLTSGDLRLEITYFNPF